MVEGQMKRTLKHRQLILVVTALGFCAAVALGIDYHQRVRPRQPSAEPAAAPLSPGARVKVERGATAIPEPVPQTGGSFDLSRNVIAGGGGTSANGNLRVDGTVGQPAAGTTVSNGQFSQTGGLWQPEANATGTPTPTPTPAPTPTPTPTPTPQAPTLLTEEGTNRAVALDSVTFVRGPFPVITFFNFSADHHTRVILFTSNLGLSQPDPSVLSVQAAGFTLTVENVGTVLGVPGLDASYIVVRLPDGLPAGDLPLAVTLRGATSNTATLGISP